VASEHKFVSMTCEPHAIPTRFLRSKIQRIPIKRNTLTLILFLQRHPEICSSSRVSSSCDSSASRRTVLLQREGLGIHLIDTYLLIFIVRDDRDRHVCARHSIESVLQALIRGELRGALRCGARRFCSSQAYR